MSNIPPITQVKETCLYVTDLNVTRLFYEEKLGLACFSFVPNRHAFFRAGTSVFLCFIAETTKQDKNLPPHWGIGALHYALESPVEEYDNWLAHFKKMEITITQEVEWPRGGRSFYFNDPDGHVGEIVEAGMWDY